MKTGDLIKRKGEDWYAMIREVKEAWPIESKGTGNPIHIVEIMWCDGDAIGDVESCEANWFEVISEI